MSKMHYLKGISMQDCHHYLDDLKDIQKQLLNFEDTEVKHIQGTIKNTESFNFEKSSA